MTSFVKAGTLLGMMSVLVFHPSELAGKLGAQSRHTFKKQKDWVEKAPKDDNQRVIKASKMMPERISSMFLKKVN